MWQWGVSDWEVGWRSPGRGPFEGGRIFENNMKRCVLFGLLQTLQYCFEDWGGIGSDQDMGGGRTKDAALMMSRGLVVIPRLLMFAISGAIAQSNIGQQLLLNAHGRSWQQPHQKRRPNSHEQHYRWNAGAQTEHGQETGHRPRIDESPRGGLFTIMCCDELAFLRRAPLRSWWVISIKLFILVNHSVI